MRLAAVRGGSAFSLIEVTLAIGIVAFALLVAIGTIPTGLQTLADAGRASTQAEIIRTLSSELKSTSYHETDTYLSSSRFPIHYDIEGVEVDAADAVFTVVARAEPAEDAPQLRVVRLLIGFQKTPDKTARLPQQNVEEFPIVVANWGF